MANDSSGPLRERVMAVVPARDAAGTIASVVAGASKHCARVIVGDDASGDGTGEEARRAGARVVVMPRRRGKGAVLRRLFAEAWSLGAEAVVAMDSDGQHDPDDVPRFLEVHEKEPAALLVGDRFAGGGPIPEARLFAQQMAATFLGHAAGCRLADSQCGFRLVPQTVAELCATRSHGFAMETEFLIAAMARGVPVRGVPIAARYREGQGSHFRPLPDFLSIASVVGACLVVRAGLEWAGVDDALMRAARLAGSGWIRLPALALAPALVPLLLVGAFGSPGRFPMFGQTREGAAMFGRDCMRLVAGLMRVPFMPR
ncbi:MAG TPA: glycosyltransferase family 2 protein [Verrucomicrobiae bacterium]|nr:glycosyltransferase family 2 protein [Verrucomicrobiae bacterium]